MINYRQYLVDIQRRQPATVNRRLEAIRRLCRWAHEQGLATSNVAATVKSVRQNKRTRPAGLADPEVHAVLALYQHLCHQRQSGRPFCSEEYELAA